MVTHTLINDSNQMYLTNKAPICVPTYNVGTREIRPQDAEELSERIYWRSDQSSNGSSCIQPQEVDE